MPKCKNCGADVKDGDLFCGFCGKRIEAAPEIPAQPISQPQLQQAAYAKEAMAQAQQPQAAPAAQPVMLKEVTLRSPVGQVKSIRTGVCWWVFLFANFVCLARKDFKWFFIILFAGWGTFLLLGFFLPLSITEAQLMLSLWNLGAIELSPDDISTMWTCIITYLVLGYAIAIVFAIKYNAIYIKGLLKKGWQPLGPNDAYTLRQKGIMI